MSEPDDVDYEIAFYEGIINKTPLFTDALIALGNAYTKAGQYEKGLSVDKRLEVLLPEDAIVLYNLGCSYSLLGDLDNALDAVKRAVACGYEDLLYMKSDPDLDNLRQDSRFTGFFSELTKRIVS